MGTPSLQVLFYELEPILKEGWALEINISLAKYCVTLSRGVHKIHGLDESLDDALDELLRVYKRC